MYAPIGRWSWRAWLPVSSPGRGWQTLQQTELGSNRQGRKKNLPRVDPWSGVGMLCPQRGGRQPDGRSHISATSSRTAWAAGALLSDRIQTHHGTGLGFKNTHSQRDTHAHTQTQTHTRFTHLRGGKRRRAFDSCAAVRMMWQATHPLPGETSVYPDLFLYFLPLPVFLCWGSPELLVIRVSWIVISWPSPAVAHTEGAASEDALFTRRDRGG